MCFEQINILIVHVGHFDFVVCSSCQYPAYLTWSILWGVVYPRWPVIMQFGFLVIMFVLVRHLVIWSFGHSCQYPAYLTWSILWGVVYPRWPVIMQFGFLVIMFVLVRHLVIWSFGHILPIVYPCGCSILFSFNLLPSISFGDFLYTLTGGVAWLSLYPDWWGCLIFLIPNIFLCWSVLCDVEYPRWPVSIQYGHGDLFGWLSLYPDWWGCLIFLIPNIFLCWSVLCDVEYPRWPVSIQYGHGDLFGYLTGYLIHE